MNRLTDDQIIAAIIVAMEKACERETDPLAKKYGIEHVERMKAEGLPTPERERTLLNIRDFLDALGLTAPAPMTLAERRAAKRARKAARA